MSDSDKPILDFMRRHAEALAPASASSELAIQLRSAIISALADLLANKHLYQSTQLDIEFVETTLAKIEPRAARPGVEGRLHSALYGHWSWQSEQPEYTGVLETPFVTVPPHTVKLYCQSCKRLEPFNVANVAEVQDGPRTPDALIAVAKRTQVIVATYQCQACKLAPEVFVVERQGLRLRLAGRSPMEAVPVPAEVPREMARFYTGATIAYQSGQALPGNFMLRTLIEQFARVQLALDDSEQLTGDELMERYMKTVPTDVRERLPSFRTIYGELSADLHSAAGSESLFESCRGRILKHFEIRKALDLE